MGSQQKCFGIDDDEVNSGCNMMGTFWEYYRIELNISDEDTDRMWSTIANFLFSDAEV